MNEYALVMDDVDTYALVNAALPVYCTELVMDDVDTMHQQMVHYMCIVLSYGVDLCALALPVDCTELIVHVSINMNNS